MRTHVTTRRRKSIGACWSIREQTLGPGHPDLAASLDDYAELLRESNRAAEAEKQEARAAAIPPGQVRASEPARVIASYWNMFSPCRR